MDFGEIGASVVDKGNTGTAERNVALPAHGAACAEPHHLSANNPLPDIDDDRVSEAGSLFSTKARKYDPFCFRDKLCPLRRR